MENKDLKIYIDYINDKIQVKIINKSSESIFIEFLHITILNNYGGEIYGIFDIPINKIFRYDNDIMWTKSYIKPILKDTTIVLQIYSSKAVINFEPMQLP